MAYGPLFLYPFRDCGSERRKMREEKLKEYLKGACTGRKYRVSGAELEQAQERFGEREGEPYG